MKSTVCIAAAILAAMSMVEASAAANLIVDGSFERPVVPDGSFQYFTNAQKFRNWTVVGDPGNVAIVSEDLNYCGHTFLTNFGTQFVDLTGNSDTATGLQQKIATNPGSTYSLSFLIGNVYDTVYNCGTSSTVNVLIDGALVATFANKGGKGSSNIAWRKFSTEFVAQHATTTIALINGDPPSDTANGLDAVNVSLVSGP